MRRWAAVGAALAATSVGVLLAATSSATPDMAAALAAVRARNAAAGSFAGRRAVVVGGTSGIGRGVALRLAEAGYAVTVVGRDAARGGAVVAACGGAGAGHEFVPTDAYLLRSATATGRAIAARHPSVDALVLTQGMGSLGGRDPTDEGVDRKLALHYFSRMAFVDALGPALAPGARVLSVLAAGAHAAYPHYATDPGLEAHYTVSMAARAACLYNDVAVEQLAAEYPGRTFVHAAPGFVATAWGTEMPWAVRGVVRALQRLGRSTADAGEFMAAPVLAGSVPGDPLHRPGGGFILMGAETQPVPPTAAQAEARAPVWA